MPQKVRRFLLRRPPGQKSFKKSITFSPDFSQKFSMSVVGVIIVLSRKEKTMNICVFCMDIGDFESCYSCNEYKGIMPLNKETLEYLGEDLEEWAEYLD
jgi:hypothetical protein